MEFYALSVRIKVPVVGKCWEMNENSSHVSNNDLLPPLELDKRILKVNTTFKRHKRL